MKLSCVVTLLVAFLGGAGPSAAWELKDITYKTDSAGKVVFSHNNHLRKKSRKSANANCKSCHASSLKVTARATMADMEKGKSCGFCHNGRRAFALSHCTRCHPVKEISYAVKETGPTRFSHKRHLATYQCGDCHNKLFKAGPNRHVAMADMAKGKSCGACHNGKTAFATGECTRCHPVKDVSYKVNGLGGVTFSHKVHLNMYSCGECHAGIYLPGPGNKAASMSAMEGGRSCGACHDGKSAFTVKENCDRCHAS